MLSPHFYWCKKSSTPISSLSQARKIAPSLFENETLQEELEYEVYKNRRQEILFIAYDIKKISRHLKEMGINLKLIKNIYFAQQVCDSMSSPLAIDDTEALALIDGVVVVIPRCYLDEEPKSLSLFINSQEINAKKIPVEGIGSFDILMYKKQFIAAGALFFLYLILQFISLTAASAALEKKIEQTTVLHKLPPTQIQLKSIMARLGKTEKEQQWLRDNLYLLSKSRKEIAGRLKLIEITPTSLHLEFSKPDDALQALIRKEFSRAQLSQGEDLLIVKVTHD